MSGNNGEETPGRADRYWVEALEETGQNNRREEREEGGREEGEREEGKKGDREVGKKGYRKRDGVI